VVIRNGNGYGGIQDSGRLSWNIFDGRRSEGDILHWIRGNGVDYGSGNFHGVIGGRGAFKTFGLNAKAFSDDNTTVQHRPTSISVNHLHSCTLYGSCEKSYKAHM
jgi:hypothetical protein